MLLATMRMPRRLLPAIAALLLLGACGRASETVQPQPVPTPGVAHSPEEAVRWLEWAWSHRDTMALRELLTDDFEFVFGLADTSRIVGWGPKHESTSNRHLFVGGGSLPPASSVALVFGRTLIPLSDPRPGRQAKWHKTILTNVDLSVQSSEGDSQMSFDVVGNARFFLVRGDSAHVTLSRGQSDSTRWFVERHEDETLPSGSLRPLPGQAKSWGRLKRLYLD